jgi:hypothetical protein
MAVIKGSRIVTSFSSHEKLRVPIAGEQLRLFTAKGPMLFEVIEREFKFMNERTAIRLVLDVAASR